MKTMLLPRELCKSGEFGHRKVTCLSSLEIRTHSGKLRFLEFTFFHDNLFYRVSYKYNSKLIVVDRNIECYEGIQSYL